MFDFLRTEKDTPGVLDEHAENPGVGATVAPSSNGSVADHQVHAAKSAAMDALQSAPRGRGRPRKNPQSGDANKPAVAGSNAGENLPPELRAEIARQLEACFEPKAWGALLACPGDVALAITAKERWNIKTEERATLGACGSAFARTLMITNPQALAGLMLGSALFSVYVPRLTMELREIAAQKKKETPEKKPA